MAFAPSFIDELLARNPIEEVVGQYVSLKRSGSNLFGLCPFHGEKTASFSVAPEKGIYYCFGCHKGGGAINFMMEIEGLSYPDAVRALAKRAGMEVPEDEQYQSRYRQQEKKHADHPHDPVHQNGKCALDLGPRLCPGTQNTDLHQIAADGTGHNKGEKVPLHGKAHRLHAGKIHPQHTGKYPPAQTANDHVEKIQQYGGQKIPVIKIPETLHDGFFLA